jgi:hypothetical protein
MGQHHEKGEIIDNENIRVFWDVAPCSHVEVQYFFTEVNASSLFHDAFSMIKTIKRRMKSW